MKVLTTQLPGKEASADALTGDATLILWHALLGTLQVRLAVLVLGDNGIKLLALFQNNLQLLLSSIAVHHCIHYTATAHLWLGGSVIETLQHGAQALDHNKLPRLENLCHGHERGHGNSQRRQMHFVALLQAHLPRVGGPRC